MTSGLRFAEGQLIAVGLNLTAAPDLPAKLRGDLKRADLSNNRIADLRAFEQCPHLHTLVLDDNDVADLAKSGLFACSALRILSLNKNRVADLDALLASILGACPQLSFLSLLGNPACRHEMTGHAPAAIAAYRAHVCSRLPALKFLDSHRVGASERPAVTSAIAVEGLTDAVVLRRTAGSSSTACRPSTILHSTTPRHSETPRKSLLSLSATRERETQRLSAFIVGDPPPGPREALSGDAQLLSGVAVEPDVDCSTVPADKSLELDAEPPPRNSVLVVEGTPLNHVPTPVTFLPSSRASVRRRSLAAKTWQRLVASTEMRVFCTMIAKAMPRLQKDGLSGVNRVFVAWQALRGSELQDLMAEVETDTFSYNLAMCSLDLDQLEPLSPYMHFGIALRSPLVRLFPAQNGPKLAATMYDLWEAMSEQARQPFEELSARDEDSFFTFLRDTAIDEEF